MRPWRDNQKNSFTFGGAGVFHNSAPSMDDISMKKERYAEDVEYLPSADHRYMKWSDSNGLTCTASSFSHSSTLWHNTSVVRAPVICCTQRCPARAPLTEIERNRRPIAQNR
jgi:hypothetical protein